MIRGDTNSDSIPIDLVNDIFSRLPVKSIARFCCLSKLWGSMFHSPYFTGLFLTRSSARPQRLLLVLEGESNDEWCFFTSPQPHIPYEKSPSLVVAADFHMKFQGKLLEFYCRASGLFYFRRAYTALERYVTCNPCTGRYLPIPKGRRALWRSFLGFDPVDKQFKVFSISFPNYDEGKENQYRIMTLGTGKDSWRKIRCPLNHVSTLHLPEGICINGVLYYLAQQIPKQAGGECLYVIVCFDVRSEKFRFMYRDSMIYREGATMFNYKGKLGVSTVKRDYYTRTLDVCMWVINDDEKQDSEWPKYFSFCWDDKVVNYFHLELKSKYFSIVGVTATGEIVFSQEIVSTPPFYVFYLNPEKNTIQRVEIQGFGYNQIDNEDCYRRVLVFVDYVEDLKFITMKTTYSAATSISPSEQKRDEPMITSSEAHLQQEDG
ncbi:hypothetical protein EUTSA_v10012275mg, partial [Eutrema salsugineum]